MPIVAFLTAGCMLPGHPDLREDYWEHDREFLPLQAACSARGIDLRAVVWDDPSLTPSDYDALVLGTTWDYAEQPQAFLAALETITRQRPLFNPLPVVRWNMRKTYLRDLAERGLPVVPTLWRDRADGLTIARAFDELGVDEIVVKPVVGASAWRQARLRRGDPLPPADALPPSETMIQPFLHAAVKEGEFSFLFFDRVFSHCAQKIPQAGDYRVQSMYGGREEAYQPSAAESALARRVLDAVDGPLLYARVDMMRGLDGQLALMELELIEPYLYPDQGPDFGVSYAAALERHLGR
jgi:glutathione synthase/RimK-type ligase-like ATP-grasp enzyme